MVVWKGSYRGRLPRINEKYAATAIRGKGRAYVTPKYRTGTEAMAMAFRTRSLPLTDPVNAYIRVGMWSRLDSDAPVKAILDALEKAGVLQNDQQIHDFVVLRDFHGRDETDWVDVMLVSVDDIITKFPEQLWDEPGENGG